MKPVSFLKKTRKNGSAKICFSCHPEDFNEYFDLLTAEILDIQDCTIYYLEDQSYLPEDLEDYYVQLSSFDLFVFPVTSRFIIEDSRAKDIDFNFAYRNGTVLPIMVEPGIYDAFNKLKSIQVLDRTSHDPTQESYLEKLTVFLKAVLLDDETWERVRRAFDAYVFLSYRKKDRKHAQEVMSILHKNDFMRDVAIWYDEFLTLGEDYNDEITAMLLKSRVMAMVVTPNIIERYGDKGNYVIEEEYPSAVKYGKPVLPVEAVKTDENSVRLNFPGIDGLIKKDDKDYIERVFKNTLFRNGIRENNDPEHLYYIGLAYLYGIDVEKDFRKGVSLILRSAESGIPYAQKTRVRILHESGFYAHALKWQKEYMSQKDSVEEYSEVEEQIKLARLTRLSGRDDRDILYRLKKELDISDKKERLWYIRIIARIYDSTALEELKDDELYKEYRIILSEYRDRERYEYLREFARLLKRKAQAYQDDYKTRDKYCQMAADALLEYIAYLQTDSMTDENERNRLTAMSYHDAAKHLEFCEKYDEADEYFAMEKKYLAKVRHVRTEKPKSFSVSGYYQRRTDLFYALNLVYSNYGEYEFRTFLDELDFERKKEECIKRWNSYLEYFEENDNYNVNTVNILGKFINVLYRFNCIDPAIMAYQRMENICGNLNMDVPESVEAAICLEKAGMTDKAKPVYQKKYDRLINEAEQCSCSERLRKAAKDYFNEGKYVTALEILEAAVSDAGIADGYGSRSKFSNINDKSGDADIIRAVLSYKLDLIPNNGYKYIKILALMLNELLKVETNEKVFLRYRTNDKSGLFLTKEYETDDTVLSALTDIQNYPVNYGFNVIEEKDQFIVEIRFNSTRIFEKIADYLLEFCLQKLSEQQRRDLNLITGKYDKVYEFDEMNYKTAVSDDNKDISKIVTLTKELAKCRKKLNRQNEAKRYAELCVAKSYIREETVIPDSDPEMVRIMTDAILWMYDPSFDDGFNEFVQKNPDDMEFLRQVLKKIRSQKELIDSFNEYEFDTLYELVRNAGCFSDEEIGAVVELICRFYEAKVGDVLGQMSEIPEGMFNNYMTKETIRIPACITRIDENAFRGYRDTRLFTVDKSNPVYTSDRGGIIEKDTLKLVLGTQEMNLSHPIKEIGNNAYRGLYGLEMVIIPESVEKIGNESFADCPDLKRVYIQGNNLKSVGKDAFRNCPVLETVYIEDLSLQEKLTDCFDTETVSFVLY